jgi:transposase
MAVCQDKPIKEALPLMLSQEEDIDANALYRRGWSISAIARHMNRDRKTVRGYVTGKREAGVRTKPADAVDAFTPFVDYVTARFAEDPHVWAVTLFEEVAELGYPLVYQTFTRHLRERALRPHCEPCSKTSGRPSAVIEHPPGEEVQWDWVELPDPPLSWDYPRKTAYLLVGALAHSGRWRGMLSESMEQPHLVDGLDRISRALGGIPRAWRFDRMATVCHPESGRVTTLSRQPQADLSQILEHVPDRQRRISPLGQPRPIALDLRRQNTGFPPRTCHRPTPFRGSDLPPRSRACPTSELYRLRASRFHTKEGVPSTRST